MSDDSQLVIRTYRPEDLEAAHALWVELTDQHRKVYADPTIGGERCELYFDRALERTGAEHMWLAIEDGRVVGLVGMLDDGENAEIDPLVVASSHRGRGLGRLMVEHAVAEARRLGMKFLSVKPVARNVEVFAFYHHVGFRILGNVELFMDLQKGEDAWAPGPELFNLRWFY
jgi:GNAT superfamily N-acetyltransferase